MGAFSLGLELGLNVQLVSGGASANNAATYADGQVAPEGYHWEFVTDGTRVIDNLTGDPIVDLAAN